MIAALVFAAATLFAVVQRPASALPSTKEKLAAVLGRKFHTSFTQTPKTPVRLEADGTTVSDAMAVAKSEKQFDLELNGETNANDGGIVVKSLQGPTKFEAKLQVTIGNGGTMTAVPTLVWHNQLEKTASLFAKSIALLAEAYLNANLKTAVNGAT